MGDYTSLSKLSLPYPHYVMTLFLFGKCWTAVFDCDCTLPGQPVQGSKAITRNRLEIYGKCRAWCFHKFSLIMIITVPGQTSKNVTLAVFIPVSSNKISGKFWKTKIRVAKLDYHPRWSVFFLKFAGQT